MPARADDAVLVGRVALGDEAALARLYDAYVPLVHGVALRVTGRRDAAEEVCQHVFLHLWSHAGDFDASRGTLRTWLAVLAHRRAVDWVRREVSRRLVLSPEATAHDDPAEEAIAALVADRLRAAVADLPPAQRDPIRWLYFDELSVHEIAQRLGIPEGTAKTRLRAARLRLAERLGAEGLVSAP